MCLNEKYSRVRVGKNLSHMFPIRNGLKQGDYLQFFQLCFRVRHQEGSGKPGWLKIKWCTSGLVYADDVNILGGSLHTMKRNTEALVVATKESGLEVNADKTKCMVIFRDQNAGRSQNIKTDNTRWFKYDRD